MTYLGLILFCLAFVVGLSDKKGADLPLATLGVLAFVVRFGGWGTAALGLFGCMLAYGAGVEAQTRGDGQ